MLKEVVRRMSVGVGDDMGLACLEDSSACDSGTITVGQRYITYGSHEV